MGKFVSWKWLLAATYTGEGIQVSRVQADSKPSPGTLNWRIKFKARFLYFIAVITTAAPRDDKAWLSDREVLITGKLASFILYLLQFKSMAPSFVTKATWQQIKVAP